MSFRFAVAVRAVAIAVVLVACAQKEQPREAKPAKSDSSTAQSAVPPPPPAPTHPEIPQVVAQVEVDAGPHFPPGESALATSAIDPESRFAAARITPVALHALVGAGMSELVIDGAVRLKKPAEDGAQREVVFFRLEAPEPSELSGPQWADAPCGEEFPALMAALVRHDPKGPSIERQVVIDKVSCLQELTKEKVADIDKDGRPEIVFTFMQLEEYIAAPVYYRAILDAETLKIELDIATRSEGGMDPGDLCLRTRLAKSDPDGDGVDDFALTIVTFSGECQLNRWGWPLPQARQLRIEELAEPMNACDIGSEEVSTFVYNRAEDAWIKATGSSADAGVGEASAAGDPGKANAPAPKSMREHHE